jgi:hypothetical protein
MVGVMHAKDMTEDVISVVCKASLRVPTALKGAQGEMMEAKHKDLDTRL